MKFKNFSQRLKSKKLEEYYLTLKTNLAKVFVSNKLNADALNSPFFIVATPGSLHLVKLCLKLIPEDQEVVLVLNGVEHWERKWVECNLRSNGLISFPFVLNHDQVIDYLLNWMDKPFGLLDYDCFVFSKDCFRDIKNINEKTSISAYYGTLNDKLGIVFPETFFVFINTPVLKKLAKKYGVNSKIIKWDDLSLLAKEKMQELGIDRHLLPESRKNYFDTLRALMVLALLEDYQFDFPPAGFINYMEEQPDDLFHVGSTFGVPYYGAKTTSPYRARGAYFWYRALEQVDDEGIKQRYYEKYGKWSKEKLLKQFSLPEEKICEFITEIENVINRSSSIN